MVLKILALIPKPLEYFAGFWNRFDCAITVIAVIATATRRVKGVHPSFYSLGAGALRSLRLIKLLMINDRARTILVSLIQGIQGCAAIFAILVIFVFIFAIMCTCKPLLSHNLLPRCPNLATPVINELLPAVCQRNLYTRSTLHRNLSILCPSFPPCTDYFGENAPVEFGTVQQSMLTLYVALTFSNWTDLYFLVYFGCDIYNRGIYVDTDEEDGWFRTASGTFHKWQCSHPERQPWVGIAFFAFQFISGLESQLTRLSVLAIHYAFTYIPPLLCLCFPWTGLL